MIAIHEYARELLHTAGQAQLPVCERGIAQALGAHVLPYSQAKDLLQALDYYAYAETVKGVSFYLDAEPYICYADDLSILERRSIIMHECGHIYLKHISGKKPLGKHINPVTENKQEREADAFSLAVLAPLHLLRSHDITCSEDIERICRLSPDDATIAYANFTKTQRHKARQRLLPSLAVLAAALLLVLLWWGNTHTTPEAPLTQLPQPNPTQGIVQELPDAQTVYITKSGSKYHKTDCYHIKSSQAIPMGLLAAQDAGYDACKSCRPNG